MTIATAFFGTPEAALPTLERLERDTDLRLVVTRPDRRAGRGRAEQASPVARWATDRGVPLERPANRTEVAVLDLSGVDVAVVVAFGMIIPESLLARPPHGFVNVHFSALPRWRGAAPVARAILAGDRQVGVSIMVLDAGLDTGPVLATRTIPADDRSAGDLTDALARIGADLLAEVLPAHVDGSLRPRPQDPAAATHAPKLTVAEARLDPSEDAEALARRVRAMHPRPGAWITTRWGRLKIHDADVVPEATVTAGRLERLADGTPALGTGRGALALRRVQPEGKGPMDGAAWARGRPGGLGEVDRRRPGAPQG